HTIVSVQPDQAVIECWSTPQRVVATDQTLLAQHTTARGAPHLAPVLSPEPVTGPRRGRRAPRPRVRRASS
ncbi:MAG: hypothetical protein ACPF9W_01085, partial [Nocardioides sp.]